MPKQYIHRGWRRIGRKIHPRKKRKEVIQKEDLRDGWKKKLEKRGNLEKYAWGICVGVSYPKKRRRNFLKTNCLKKYSTMQFARDVLYTKPGLQELIINSLSTEVRIQRTWLVLNLGKWPNDKVFLFMEELMKMIREAINIQDPNIEVDEKEIDNDAHFTIYNIITTNDARFDVTTLQVHDIPYDKAEVWLLINWILKYKLCWACRKNSIYYYTWLCRNSRLW